MSSGVALGFVCCRGSRREIISGVVALGFVCCREAAGGKL